MVSEYSRFYRVIHSFFRYNRWNHYGSGFRNKLCVESL